MIRVCYAFKTETDGCKGGTDHSVRSVSFGGALRFRVSDLGPRLCFHVSRVVLTNWPS